MFISTATAQWARLFSSRSLGGSSLKSNLARVELHRRASGRPVNRMAALPFASQDGTSASAGRVEGAGEEEGSVLGDCGLSVPPHQGALISAFAVGCNVQRKQTDDTGALPARKGEKPEAAAHCRNSVAPSKRRGGRRLLARVKCERMRVGGHVGVAPKGKR